MLVKVEHKGSKRSITVFLARWLLLGRPRQTICGIVSKMVLETYWCRIRCLKVAIITGKEEVVVNSIKIELSFWFVAIRDILVVQMET